MEDPFYLPISRILSQSVKAATVVSLILISSTSVYASSSEPGMNLKQLCVEGGLHWSDKLEDCFTTHRAMLLAECDGYLTSYDECTNEESAICQDMGMWWSYKLGFCFNSMTDMLAEECLYYDGGISFDRESLRCTHSKDDDDECIEMGGIVHEGICVLPNECLADFNSDILPGGGPFEVIADNCQNGTIATPSFDPIINDPTCVCSDPELIPSDEADTEEPVWEDPAEIFPEPEDEFNLDSFGDGIEFGTGGVYSGPFL